MSIGNLLRTGSNYIDCSVRVKLPASSYNVRRDGIEFPSPRTTDPPAAVFLSNSPPKDNTRLVTVVGTVSQINRDGVPRLIGVEGQVIVRDCTITADPAPAP